MLPQILQYAQKGGERDEMQEINECMQQVQCNRQEEDADAVRKHCSQWLRWCSAAQTVCCSRAEQIKARAGAADADNPELEMARSLSDVLARRSDLGWIWFGPRQVTGLSEDQHRSNITWRNNWRVKGGFQYEGSVFALKYDARGITNPRCHPHHKIIDHWQNPPFRW